MKKTLVSLAAAVLSLTACDTAAHFTIKGKVEGEKTGKVYLIKYEGRQKDTLAQAPVTDGKFVINGEAGQITPAYLYMEGKRLALPIFLENAAFTAVINPADPTRNKVEGTENQKIANQFIAISNETQKEESDLYKEYSTAAQANDTVKMKEIEGRYQEITDKKDEEEKALIKAYADSYIAAYMLASKMSGLQTEELKAQYELLGANARATEMGQEIEKRIDKLSKVEVGKTAPDFTLNTPEGKPLSMHSVKGKVKLIDFWASWCGPCRGENPNVVKVYQEFHPKGLEILSVSLDTDKDAWLKAIEKDKLTWNHVSDLKGWQNEAAQLYAVNAIPHLIIVDENNVIVAKNLRGEALREKIAELLK